MKTARFVLLGAALALVTAAAAALPGAVREAVYLRQLGNGSFGDVRCVLLPGRREVTIEAEGLAIRGDLYPAHGGSDQIAPAVVLLHGSSPHGRRLPLYPALAHEMAEAGYHVLAIDLRGFGESDDPVRIEDAAAWDFPADAIAAVDSLLLWVPVDTARIHLVGHSFGAGPALAAAQRDDRIRSVVMIGPTRRYTERFLRRGAPDSAYYVQRWRRDMRLPREVPYQVMASVSERQNVENYAGGPYRSRVPVLLTDGQHEDPRDLDALRSVAQRMGPVATYWTTPGTDHYLHTARLMREAHAWAPEPLAATACYNERVLEPFVGTVDLWLRSGKLPG